MAASRMTLCLLGLVVVATAFAAAEATTTPCTTCGGGGGGPPAKVDVDLVLNLEKCKPAVLVEVVTVVLKGKGLKVCPGGKATWLAPLKLKLKVKHLVVVKVVLLGKHGKPVLKVVLKLDLVKLKVKLVGGRYLLVVDVVVDVKTQQLLFLCLGVQVHAPIDLRVYLGLLDLVHVGVGTKGLP